MYFSFLPVKQRDFPGNVGSGGRDSLPLVVAFTSKQRDSPLSYALHFLRIISHQMCCAVERAEGRTQPSGKKAPGTTLQPHRPGGNAGSGGSFLRAVRGNQLCALIPKLEEEEERKGGERAEKPDLYFSDWPAWTSCLFALTQKRLAWLNIARLHVFLHKCVVTDFKSPGSAHRSARAEPGSLGNA